VIALGLKGGVSAIYRDLSRISPIRNPHELISTCSEFPTRSYCCKTFLGLRVVKRSGRSWHPTHWSRRRSAASW